MDDSLCYVFVTNPADLSMVVSAVGESGLVGLDTETTGLDPRTDRVRLLSLACDTVDGGTAVYSAWREARAELNELPLSAEAWRG